LTDRRGFRPVIPQLAHRDSCLLAWGTACPRISSARMRTTGASRAVSFPASAAVRRDHIERPFLEPPCSRQSLFSVNKGAFMRSVIIILAVTLIASATYAKAQGGSPSGRGSTTGDPAASSATPGTSPTTGSSKKASPSGSGTSTSGGSDANGDQGRDKCRTAT
jgi:hypothetical protein